MGYYIQGPAKGKAKYICDNHRGHIITESEAKVLAGNSLSHIAAVCVVDNGAFEAAAFLFSSREFDAFTTARDFRPRTFVALERSVARELTGYKGL